MALTPEETATATKAAEGSSVNKAEFEKKFGNLESSLKQSNTSLEAKLAAIQEMIRPKQVQKTQTDVDKELEDMVWNKPAELVQRIKQEAKLEATQMLNEHQAAQTKIMMEMGALNSLYPELQQAGHGLNARATEIYNGLTAEEKAGAGAFKLAVATAASEYGLKPTSKRSEDEMDDFTLKATGKTRKAGPKVKKTTTDFASLMGLDVDDPKVMTELEKYAGLSETDWRKWKNAR